MSEHDLHSFLEGVYDDFQREHKRIYKRTPEDPGTAGDQGEENWADFLREWLPPAFKIVTKGRILFEDSTTSDQIDVLVLRPSYPKALFNKKHYLAGGVAAAFECKNTLKRKDIEEAIATGAKLKRKAMSRFWKGTPYKEMNAPIFYGLLAHSHSWTKAASTPVENIKTIIDTADEALVKHPCECLDVLTVADLGSWSLVKTVSMGVASLSTHPSLKGRQMGKPTTAYVSTPISEEQGNESFTPIGTLLTTLYGSLSWAYTDMRSMNEYFSQIRVGGNGQGDMREWDYNVFSTDVQKGIREGKLVNFGMSFSEWQAFYMY